MSEMAHVPYWVNELAQEESRCYGGGADSAITSLFCDQAVIDATKTYFRTRKIDYLKRRAERAMEEYNRIMQEVEGAE